jgi:hypothetical protein
MHSITLKLPNDISKHIAKEAESLGLSYSKHLLATLDAMATNKSKELINYEFTTKHDIIRRTTANYR